MSYSLLSIMTNLILNSENRIQNLETGLIVLGVLFFLVFAFFISFIIILEKQIDKLTNKKNQEKTSKKSQNKNTENDGE